MYWLFWQGRACWITAYGMNTRRLLQGDSGGCIRELQPYDAAGERYLARLAGEANGFRLCQILFELLLNFLHRNTGFDCG